MQVSQEVLAVLSDLDVSGRLVRMATQLDRPTYTKVNKVLEAIGGKWSRAAKAHMFLTDARPLVDLVITTGRVETGQDVGWFPTPAPLAAELVRRAGVQHGDYVLEPSAGEGAIVVAIQDAGGHVLAVERDPNRREHLLEKVLKGHDYLSVHDDFMHYRMGYIGDDSDRPNRFDRVVMNPPFCKVGEGDHLDHVHHAYSMLKPGGVLVSVMPSSIEFRRDSRYRQFREWVLDSGTIEGLPEGSFRASGTGVNTCVIRMER